MRTTRPSSQGGLVGAGGGRARRGVVLLALAALFASVSPIATALERAARGGGHVPVIEVLSNRADLISGGDALVRVTLPENVDPSAVRMRVDTRAVTGQFAVRENGRYEGLLHGLRVGSNVLDALLPDGSGARIVITNHPRGGPIFSGPQLQPWVCTTEVFGLGPPQDDQCNAETTREVYFKNKSTGEFEPYDVENPPPPQAVAETRTDEGLTVPYIVLAETGTLNRGIYKIAVLYDPTQPWEPWAPQQQWNEKVFNIFGHSCGGHYDQGTSLPDPVVAPPDPGITVEGYPEFPLSRGFAVATSTSIRLGEQCNFVVAAEALMMLRERITETLGPFRYNIGDGCSGGSMLQTVIADQYPGLLEGLRPNCSLADMWMAKFESHDCTLLARYFNLTSPHLWGIRSQRDAVTNNGATCDEMGALGTAGVGRPGSAIWFEPSGNCGQLPPEKVYEPESNPRGERCNVSDYMINLAGRRPQRSWGPVEMKIGRGFANRMMDNVGVQYGLNALQAGDILPAQFVDLNEKVGGVDIDAIWQSQRTLADRLALERWYRKGHVMYGRNLAKVPIIDIRGNNNHEIHYNLGPQITRARLVRSNGTAANQVLWMDVQTTHFGQATPEVSNQSLVMIDRWLAAIEADRRPISQARKVIDNKPQGAEDACWSGTERLEDGTSCQTLAPYLGTPRLVAGMPLTHDVLKCELKPLRRDDYNVEFTDGEWERLQAAFPDGVCDWSKPGVAQQPPGEAWQTYADGPDGDPLGGPPQSISFQSTANGGAPDTTPPQGSRPATGASLAATGAPRGVAVLAVLLLTFAACLVLSRRREFG